MVQRERKGWGAPASALLLVAILAAGASGVYLLSSSGAGGRQGKPSTTVSIEVTNSTDVTSINSPTNSSALAPTASCPTNAYNPRFIAPTYTSMERKILKASGLIWEFYSNGTGIVYRTSASGANWSSPTEVLPGSRSWWFTTYQSLTTADRFWFAYASSAYDDPVEWGNGTLNANGTITWGGPFQRQAAIGTNPNTPALTFDASGHMWLAIETYRPDGARHIEVYELREGLREVLDVGGFTAWPMPVLSALSNGDIVLSVLTAEGGLISYSTSNGGATWSGPYNATGSYQDVGAVSAGDTVYFAGATRNGTIRAWNFTPTSGYGLPFRLSLPTQYLCGVAISTDGVSRLAVVFSNATSVFIRSTDNLGSTWGATTVVGSGSRINWLTLTSAYFIRDDVLTMWSELSTNGTYSIRTSLLPWQ